jgi:predicted AAA+ superfamily ATPase
LHSRDVGYWRNKSGHEIDFVLSGRRKHPIAIECKWAADKFDPANLAAFRRQHPEGENVVLAEDVNRKFTRTYGPLIVRFEPLDAFVESLA